MDWMGDVSEYAELGEVLQYAEAYEPARYQHLMSHYIQPMQRRVGELAEIS
ncbi:hypothetical protein [Sporosarcina trichiuri]|uniref:hypothetical protein n=1 Tax=Sporosarcina trichiuri TaxID=3056445 RepID=UPI0025B331F8|nr:hypothetical protein [Sporosarcina sp. 0.2-SM1T-5]WJY27286.1 hypothetical protein QWT68_14790 [Sporosarcina sp. 0.2-SM1T-5]